MSMERWTRVIFASDCLACEECGEPICLNCEDHYADCDCPGPSQEDEFKYMEKDGVLYARRIVN